MVSLRKLVDEIEETPVSLEFVRDRLPPRCKAVKYQDLKGKHRSAIFKGVDALVVLIPKKGEDIGHFICLVPGQKSIEYFSSLGQSPWVELEKLHESRAIFEQLLGARFNYNRRAVQGGAYNINTCAAWVLLRAHFHGFKLRQFQSLFDRRITLETPDEIAATMAACLFQDR